MNCCMIRRVLAVATILVAVCFAVAAQQGNRTAAFEQSQAASALEPAFALSLYQPKNFSAKNSSLLFHKARVLVWSDGGALASVASGWKTMPASQVNALLVRPIVQVL